MDPERVFPFGGRSEVNEGGSPFRQQFPALLVWKQQYWGQAGINPRGGTVQQKAGALSRLEGVKVNGARRELKKNDQYHTESPPLLDTAEFHIA